MVQIYTVFDIKKEFSLSTKFSNPYEFLRKLKTTILKEGIDWYQNKYDETIFNGSALRKIKKELKAKGKL